MADGAAAPAVGVVGGGPRLSEEEGEKAPLAVKDAEEEPQLQLLPERETWDNRLQFFLSCVGYSVGLGNVWRFPYLVYANGGGSFLIPYFIALVLLGIPLYLLELTLGQVFKRSTLSTLRTIHWRLGGTGIAMAVEAALVSLYYNVVRPRRRRRGVRGGGAPLRVPSAEIDRLALTRLARSPQVIAWSLFYLVQSFRNPLPWIDAGAESYFNDDVLRMSSGGITDVGGLVGPLVGALAVAWAIIYLAIFKGIGWSGKLVYFTATFPFVLLIALFFISVTRDGAGEGIKYDSHPHSLARSLAHSLTRSLARSLARSQVLPDAVLHVPPEIQHLARGREPDLLQPRHRLRQPHHLRELQQGLRGCRPQRPHHPGD